MTHDYDPQQYAVLTDVGTRKLNALAAGQRLTIKYFVLGDGNGQAVSPDPSGTALVHEIGRETITERASDYLAAGIFMSPGLLDKYQGQWLREVGLVDEDGDLIVWACYAPTIMSMYAERTILVHLPITYEKQLTIVIDTTKKWVTQAEVDALLLKKLDVDGKAIDSDHADDADYAKYLKKGDQVYYPENFFYKGAMANPAITKWVPNSASNSSSSFCCNLDTKTLSGGLTYLRFAVVGGIEGADNYESANILIVFDAEKINASDDLRNVTFNAYIENQTSGFPGLSNVFLGKNANSPRDYWVLNIRLTKALINPLITIINTRSHSNSPIHNCFVYFGSTAFLGYSAQATILEVGRDFSDEIEQIKRMIEPQDFSNHAADLADPLHDIYGTLPAKVVAAIPAGVMQPLLDTTGKTIFTPQNDIPYVLSITTIKTGISFVQSIVFIEQTENVTKWNLTFQRSGQSFTAAKIGWVSMLGLPPGDLYVDGNIFATKDVQLLDESNPSTNKEGTKWLSLQDSMQ